jgi:hypothetical protein
MAGIGRKPVFARREAPSGAWRTVQPGPIAIPCNFTPDRGVIRAEGQPAFPQLNLLRP